MRQKLLPLIPFLFIACNMYSYAQTWVEMMHDPNANFYDTKAVFDSTWAGITPDKGKGYNVFRRWENFMEPRVYPKGNVTDASKSYEEFNKYLDQHPEIAADLETRAANWVPLGPYGTVSGGGAGRVNFVRFDPTNSNIMYIGTPAGGLWKSTNAGTNWTTNTDQLAVIGCTDIAIDPTNTNIMYLATGDGDAQDTYSVGVLKSTDGGVTWNTTGLNWTASQGRSISRLLINPSNTQILLAATSIGIERTTDGGTTWSVATGTSGVNYKDMEFRPSDPTTIYACGTTFWKSTNSGSSFTNITSGVPTGVSRLAIAVTPANNTYVYMLAGNNTNYGLTGVYRSTDNGTTFTLRDNSPNYLGWQSNGSDAGGQAWYDLPIAVSNTNADVVVIGGVNIWRSINGGTSFTINGHWTGSGAPYVHADEHDLIFLPGSGSTYYSGNDGGIFRTTNDGTAWTDISSQMNIAQQYRIGLAPTNSGIIISGHQDNGVNKLSGGVWSQVYGGDGMDSYINRTSNTMFYSSYVYGEYRRSINSGGVWTNCYSSIPTGSGNASWLSVWHQDPVTATTFYAGGRAALYRTTDITVASGGWVALGTPGGSGNIVEFDVAPSNNQIIYAINSNRFSRSSNGGTSWTNNSTGLPVASAALTNVEVSPTQPNKVWVTFSGYSSGNKVFMTTNGGTTWTNYSTGLPNLPANCIVFQVGAVGQTVYVGTDVGIYVRDSVDATWNPYLAGLPRVPVNDMEIYYSAPVKIRAGTYGRGTWESDVYSSGSQAPLAGFTSNRQIVCPGQTVSFTDQSSFSPTSWSWSFPGGTPATSTSQNPTITYNTAGTYDVTLTATNANGSNTTTQTAYIIVTGPQALPLVEGFEGATFAPANWSLTDVNSNGTWFATNSAGGFGASAQSAVIDNYNVDEAGTRDDMRTPKYVFTGLTSATMTFDVAYARYSSVYSDTLEVVVSTDCGVTFTQVYIKGGTTLATNGGADQTSIFIPTAAQWRTETVNLNAYIGQANVMVAFRNHGRYGNVIWVDNVNITGVSGSLPVASFTTSGNTICTGQTVTYTNTSTGATSFSWAFPGGAPATGTTSPIVVTYAAAGTYTTTLTATNAFGNSTSTQTITVNANPTANATNGGPYCVGATIQLNSVGGSATNDWAGPNAYLQNNVQNPTIASATTAMGGVYTVTVTNAANCTATSTTTVTINTNPIANATNTGPYCAGTTIQLNSVGGSATDDWAGPGAYTANNTQNPTRPTSTVAMSGVYTVTVTNASGCTSTSTTTVTVNANPTANATNGGPYCAGATIQLNSVGGSATDDWAGPLAYSAANTQNPTIAGSTVAMTGVYTVTVTNASGCISTSTTTVTVNANPTANATNGGPYCAGTTIQLNSVGGSATDDWAGPGAYIANNTQNPTRPTSTVAMSGVYTVTVTNASGCTSTSTTTVTVNANPVANATNTGPYCAGATIQLNSVGGSATDDWAGPGAYTATNTQNPTRPTSTVAMSGVYTVTVTNAAGCTSTSTTTVTVNALPTPNATNGGPYCVGATIQLNSVGGSATDDWAGPLGYSVNNTQNPTIPGATVAMSGSYTVTVTNASGCTSTSTTAVTVNTLPTPTATNTGPYCVGGTIQLNSTGGGTYAWTGPLAYSNATQNPTISSATVGMAGTYTITVTLGGGCTASATTAVIVNTNPTASSSNTGPYCVGTIIQLNSSGGTTYSWSGPLSYSNGTQNPTIASATSAMAGNYTVTVTNASGCTSTSSTNVVINALPIANATNTGPYCVGATIQLNSVGGTATDDWAGPGAYSAPNVQNPTRPSATGAMSGVYTVTVTNAAGCTSTSTTTVAVIVPSATASNTGPYCVGSTIQLNSTGGGTYAWTGPLAYSNSTQNPTIASATVGMAGTYTITVTLGGGCTASATTAVVVNTNPTATSSNTGPYCVGATIQLNSTGGTGYSWSGPLAYSNGTQNPTIASATTGMAGNYTVTVTNASGCTSTSSTNVVVNALPPNTASNTGPYCAGASIQLNASAGATDYDWIGPNAYIQNNTQNPVIASSTTAMSGLYTVTITNAAGCTSTTTTNVTVNAIPTASASNGGPYCVGSTIQLNSIGGSATDDWAGPLGYTATNIQSPTIASAAIGMSGLYTVTVTNAAGCTSTSTTNVVVNANPIANATNTGPYCAGATIQLNSVGGTVADDWVGPNAYLQNNSQNPTIPGSIAAMSGLYTVTLTNGSGCTATATTNVIVNPLPAATAGSNSPLCEGQTLNLNSSGGLDYDWTGPNSYVQNNSQNPSIPGILIANAGVYTVTVTDAAGCINTATANVVINTSLVIVASSNSPVCLGSNIDLTVTTVGGGVYTWTGPNSFSSGLQNPIIVSSILANAGIYSVTVTNGSCSGTSTVNVVINNAPLPIAGNNSPICEGEMLFLNSNGGVDFDWTGPNSYVQNNNQNPVITPATPANSGTYTVTVTDASGCSATATTFVTVNPSPGVPTITESGDTLHAIPSAGFSFQWYMNGSISIGETDSIYLVSQTAIYSVVITDGNGCTATSIDYSYISTVSIEGFEDHEHITVYPNPNDGTFNVTVSSDHANEFNLRIYNMLGAVIYQKNDIPTSELEGYKVDLSTMAVGTYNMVVYINGKAHTMKVVKK